MAYGKKPGGSKKSPLVSSNLEQVSRKVESVSYVDEFVENKDAFMPDLDFTNPANFAKFGSAEQYYIKAAQNIYQFYPYDGSAKEKLEWLNSCTYFDRHVFENEYPRTNGHIEIGETWGSVSTTKTVGSDVYKLSDAPQYISIKGGPNGPSTPAYATSSYSKPLNYKELEQKANIFNKERNQKQNLTVNGVDGNTVEFWFKFPENALSDQESPHFAFFDLWNGNSINTNLPPSNNYGRFLIETKTSSNRFQESCLFNITYRSGSSGVTSAKLGACGGNTVSDAESTFNITLNKWNHYAFTVENNPTGSDHLLMKLYINGNLVETSHTGSQVGEVRTGPFNANIGAYRHAVNFAGATAGVSNGYGTITGSFDEFRFWTIKRQSDDISFNWFRQIDGGTNTDYGSFENKFTGSTNPVNLGVYYKFNEGITATSSYDRIAIDYSGRVSNGFISNYSSNMRSTDSAIVKSNAATSEFKDPIIYDFHPLVSSYIDEVTYKGREYDQTNTMNLYKTLPNWILEGDETIDPASNAGAILALTQIMASQFDDLFIKTEALPGLKDGKYLSGSLSGSMNKPLPFADRLLTSKGFPAPEIFSNANVYEALANRNDKFEFQRTLSDVKNQIYTNLYNNLSYINKSKGTEKSIQAILNCFGIGQDVYSINFYSNNARLNINRSAVSTTVSKKYVDFDHVDRRSATVYQMTSSVDSNSVSFITSSATMTEIPFTVETEVIFPRKPSYSEEAYADKIYTEASASLFGIHQVASYATGDAKAVKDTSWANDDDDFANFQVYAVKKSADPSRPEFKQVYFVLTSSDVGSGIQGLLPPLESDIYSDVYDDQKWNFAVKLSPSRYPNVGILSGSELGAGNPKSDFKVEFIGINTAAGTIQQSFHLSGTIASPNGSNIFNKSKRVYVGAHRSNFTGSVLSQTDVKISSCRYWQLALEHEEIMSHAMDPTNYGVFNPMQNAFLLQNADTHLAMSDNPFPFEIPKAKTLILNWDFNNLTGSDSGELNGQFSVSDFSSGSSANVYPGTVINTVFGRHHTGRAAFFPSENNYTGSISNENINGLVQQVPENLNSYEMISVIEDQDKYFDQSKKPVQFSYGIEKSMYQTISEEMIDFIAASKDSSGMENLIGEPVDRYRQSYKKLDKIKQIFFERISNTPDLDRYLEFYKWLDNSISEMVQHVVPASSDFRDVTNVIESHVFERSGKYVNKAPLLNRKLNNDLANAPLLTSVQGIGALGYNWNKGHAPVGGNQSTNMLWWKHRALREDFSTGNPAVDTDRGAIFSASYQTFNRNFNAPYSLSIKRGPSKKSVEFQNRSENANNDLNYRQTVFSQSPAGTSNGINFVTSTFLSQSNVAELDSINPSRKYKTGFKLNLPQVSNSTYVDGRKYSPITFYSASFPTAILPGYQLTTQHLRDYYVETKEIPMQGPFTEQNVGGYAYRHGGLNLGVASIRQEGWYAYRTVLPNKEVNFTLLNPFDISTGYPRALYSRDGLAKRPLNIANIKSTTSSANTQNPFLPPVNNLGSTKVYNGNYSENYDIVQISGREVNNRFFVDNNGISTASAPSIGTPSVSGAYDWSVPNRGKNSHIFVSKFAAPGGPEIAGAAFNDYQSDTFSVYNALPFRNLSVRQPLQTLLTSHSLFGGYSSDYGAPSASFHKTQRNARKYTKATGIFGTTATSDVYDNYYVQHQIPQSDSQYAWITASATSTPLGFSQKDFSNSSFASTDITFANQSDFGAFINTALGTGKYILGRPQATAGNYFLPQSFAGLNTFSFSYNKSGELDSNLSYPNANLTLVPFGIVSGGLSPELPREFLNLYLLKNNGPYGYPSWKQIRSSGHPVAKYMRKINRLSLLTEQTSISPGDSKLQKIKTQLLQNFTEPPVSFKFKPLKHSFRLKTGKGLVLKNTFSNNLSSFTDNKINKILNFRGNEEKEEIYSKMKKIYVDKQIPDSYSPIESLLSLKYGEVVYPRERNTGLAKVRGRENYTVSSGSADFNLRLGDSRAFWKNTFNDRLRSDAEARNAQGLIIASGSSYFGLTDMSIWPLDSEEPFYDLYQFSSSDAGLRGGGYDPFYWAPLSPSGATFSQPRFNNVNKNGELSYAGYIYALFGINIQGKVRFENSPTASGPLPNFLTASSLGLNYNPTASFQFEYPNMMMSGSKYSYIRPTASLHLIAPYRTDVLSGKTPWFNSYEDYADDIRRIAKDYTVVPEFRITDHMDYYLDQGFFADNSKFLDLVGASLNNTSSAASQTGAFQADFFKIYSHSDFMKHFSVIQEDHRKDDAAFASKIKMQANGIKKLLPYQGFYPALRSVQLGRLFSASYGPHLDGSSVRDGDQERLAALYQPFFAPGIFFNTIKSGIAVSYPVHTASAPEVDTAANTLNVQQPTTASNFISNQYTTTPNYSFPFEAILDPDQFLPLSSSLTSSTVTSLSSSVYFVYPNFTGSTRSTHADGFYAVQSDDSPYTAARLGALGVSRKQPQIYFQWKGESSPKYSLASSNFFAESVDFFLEKGTLTSFISKPEKDFKSMTSGSVYYMDVILYKTEKFVSYEGPPSGTFNYDGGSNYFESLTTDTRNARIASIGGDGLSNKGISARGMHYGPSYKAHGVPIGSTGTGSIPFATFRAQDPTYAPHTPPYFYGKSRARIAFKPHAIRDMVDGESAKFTLEEILSNAKVETIYENENDLAKTLQEDSYRNGFPAGRAQMQLSSSVNLFGQITLKEVQYGTERNPDGSFKAEKATTPVVQGTNDAWIIETKFECPSINMANMDTSSLGAGIGDGKEKYHTRGIWKGYGHPPSGSEGIFLQLRESYPQVVNNVGDDTVSDLTGSLIEVCGFKASKERIGKIKGKKTISEAIVAVPIDEKGNFFSIDPKMYAKQKSNYETSNKALLAGDFGAETDIGETSITEMIEKMKKFSLPPQMDFINNTNVDPFVMYIFEFTHSLDREDLADIWQNLMPKISTNAERATSTIEHSIGVNYEFFGQYKKGQLPDNIRWMVFKVKQKARNNFFNVTQQSEVAKGFTFTALKELQGIASNSEAELTYSYNWPYDFFSLVELAQVEAEIEFKSPKTRSEISEVDKKSGNVKTKVTYEDKGRG